MKLYEIVNCNKKLLLAKQWLYMLKTLIEKGIYWYSSIFNFWKFRLSLMLGKISKNIRSVLKEELQNFLLKLDL